MAATSTSSSPRRRASSATGARAAAARSPRSASPSATKRGRSGSRSSSPRLLHRYEVLHLPHSAKNKFLLTGWRAYDHPSEALHDLFRCRLNNETMNVLSAFFALLTLFFTHVFVFSHADLLHDHHESALLRYGVACGINAFLVASYHALAPYGKWYDGASAMDLGAIALVAWASQGVSFCIPGASAFGSYLDGLDLDRDGAAGSIIFRLLRGFVVPVVASLISSQESEIPTRIAAYWFTSTATIAIGVYAVVRRTLVSGETPLPLLALNFAAVLFNVLDLAVASPRPFSFMAAAFLFFGGALYAAKVPERFFLPNAGPIKTEKREENEAGGNRRQGHGKKGTSAAVACASLLLPSSNQTATASSPSYRAVDVFFHSHLFHHVCYSTTMLLCASDFAFLAMKHACTTSPADNATAHGGVRDSIPSSNDDIRCALFR